MCVVKMLALAIFFLGITSTNNALAAEVKPHKITLLPHQKQPIEYLYKHKEIKGLLINHYLGTGKTILALGFAEKYPKRPVVIIAPRFLQSSWQIQMRKFGIKDKSRYTIVSFRDSPKMLKNTALSNAIVIVDEVHKLIALVRSPIPKIRLAYSDLYFRMRGAHKILALTGTPIYNNASDIAYLTNFVSGKDILPYNEQAFRDEFTRIRHVRSFF